METLYKFFVPCGLLGDLEGLFISTPEEVASVIGKKIIIDEPFGQHSEFSGILEDHDIKEISTDPKVINIMKKDNLLIGYNPLNFISE